MISGGRLRWVATVQRASAAVDALGRRTSTFTDVGTVRVDMRENGSAEQTYADGVAVVARWEIRMRWPNIARLAITELDRLVVRGKTMRITSSINLDERDRLAVLDCTEVV
jgi:head-tail adaptor